MKKLNTLILLTSICSIQACADTNKINNSKKIEVNTLVEFNEEGSCNPLLNYSVFLEFKDYDYELTVFEDKECKTDKRITSITLDAETNLLGEWNSLLVVDIGTSSSNRTLELIDPRSKFKTRSIDYIGEPIFTSSEISIFRQDDEKNEQKNNQLCPPQPLVKGAQPSLQISALKWIYRHTNSKMEKTTKTRCYPLE